MRLRPPSDTGIQDVVRVAAGSVESTIIVQVPTVRRLGILYNSSSMEGERSLVTVVVDDVPAPKHIAHVCPFLKWMGESLIVCKRCCITEQEEKRNNDGEFHCVDHELI